MRFRRKPQTFAFLRKATKQDGWKASTGKRYPSTANSRRHRRRVRSIPQLRPLRPADAQPPQPTHRLALAFACSVPQDRAGTQTARSPIMKVELRNINDIKPYPHNPRKNDQAVEAVA